ncbi:MAG: cupin domain-containing protein [Vulcanimicrobiaceae bacterium]
MQETVIDGLSMWSVWQPDRNLYFNSFFVRGDGGNLVIDPLPLDESSTEEMVRRGVAWIVITNRDHERSARTLSAATGAKIAASRAEAPLLGGAVDRALESGELICGARVIPLDGLKTPGEIALWFVSTRTLVVGDALWGDPAGSLRLMPDGKLADPARAVTSMRRLRMVYPSNLLVGDGTCLFGNAYEALGRCLDSRSGALAARINLDELFWLTGEDGPERYRGCSDAEVGFAIGAQRLGYRMARVPAGRWWCPNHWHSAEEELFIVVEGAPTLQTPNGSFLLRRGDFVAFPVGPGGAHKLVNDSNADALLLMISNVSRDDVCYYPDSQKLLIEQRDLIVRDGPALDYFEGE